MQQNNVKVSKWDFRESVFGIGNVYSVLPVKIIAKRNKTNPEYKVEAWRKRNQKG